MVSFDNLLDTQIHAKRFEITCKGDIWCFPGFVSQRWTVITLHGAAKMYFLLSDSTHTFILYLLKGQCQAFCSWSHHFEGKTCTLGTHAKRKSATFLFILAAPSHSLGTTCKYTEAAFQLPPCPFRFHFFGALDNPSDVCAPWITYPKPWSISPLSHWEVNLLV